MKCSFEIAACVFVDRNFKDGNLKVRRVKAKNPKRKSSDGQDSGMDWTTGQERDFVEKKSFISIGKKESFKKGFK